MKRRNFLKNLLLWILAFFFGYTISKEGENWNLFKTDAGQVLDGDGKKITDKIGNLNEHLGDIGVSITQFGGSVNSNDNRQAIQNAINYIDGLGGGTVYVPSGIFKVKATNVTLELKSSVNLRGAGKEQSVLKISENTGDWGYLFIASGYLLKKVEITDLTLDCNVDNRVTKTERWQNSNRVLVNVGEAIDFKMKNVKMISNGIWGFRGFVQNGELSDNEFHFIPPSYPNASFDVSTIWMGGENNTIKNNRLTASWRSNFIPETAIETQGHYSRYENNTVKGYKVGLIVSCNTGYENTLNPITTLGANSNKVLNNTFDIFIAGTVLWTMHVTQGSVIDSCMIANNSITVLGTDDIVGRYKFGVGIFKANLETGAIHDGIQTGTIKNLIINNNFIIFKRRVRKATDKGDIGIKLDCEFEIDGVTINGNSIKNIGDYGIYLNATQDKNLNPTGGSLKNVAISNNVFSEVRSPIWINSKVKRVSIISNIFSQDTLYSSLYDNCIYTVDCSPGESKEVNEITVVNNVFKFMDIHKPFYPRYFLPNLAISNFNPEDQNILEENTIGKTVIENQTGRPVIVQPSNYLLGKDAKFYKVTNSIQATSGTLTTSSGGDVMVTRIYDDFSLVLNDTSNISPSQSLSVMLSDFTFTQFSVLAVVGTTVRFAQNVRSVTLKSKIYFYKDKLLVVS